MRAAAALLVLALCAAPAAAQEETPAPEPLVVRAADGPLSVTLRVDPARPVLGQEVTLSFMADIDGVAPPAPVDVRWPDVGTALVDGLGEDVAEARGALPSGDGRTLDATLHLYDAGTFELPALTVTAMVPGETEPRTVELSGAAVEIVSVLATDAVPVKSREPLEWDAPFAVPDWVLVGLGTFALAAVALALTVWLRRRRGGEEPATAAPPPPPHHAALAALEALLARRLPEQGLVDPYFVELSEILRRYVEDRFGLRAPEQTTEEFLATASSTPEGRRAVTAAHRDLLRDFLTRADLVKFARAVPDAATCDGAAASARTFVEETIPPPPVEPEGLVR